MEEIKILNITSQLSIDVVRKDIKNMHLAVYPPTGRVRIAVEAAEYEKYLEEIVKLAVKVKKPETSNEYPSSINTQAKRALYDNLEKDEPLTIAMDSAVIYGKHDDWEGTLSKEKHLKNKVVKPVLEEYHKVEKLDPIFEIIKQQKEYK